MTVAPTSEVVAVSSRGLFMRVLAALAGGLSVWGAFPPVDVGWLAVVGVALITVAVLGVRMRAAFCLGLLAGLAFFLPLLPWLTVVGIDAWLALSGFCALWFSLMAVAVMWAGRLPGWPIWIACIWVAQETLRSTVPFGGFPWGRLSFAQADTAFGHVARYGGLSTTTFFVALAGTATAAVLLQRRWRWAAVAAVCVLGSWLLPLASMPSTGTAVVAAVQGGTPQTGMGAFDVRRAVLDAHVAQTLNLARAIESGAEQQPAFVLWPENASDLDPYRDPEAAQAITAASRAVNAPILVGAVTDAADRQFVWNNGIVWNPDQGPGERYIKNHPVPFGEYIPFRNELAKITDRFDRIPRDFEAGNVPGHLDIGGIAVGDLICFEVAYDDVVNALMASPERSTLITVQTNNATYNGTAQPAQQLAISRMRAIETGRTVLVAATSGISARINHDGRLAAQIDEGETGVLNGSIALVAQAPMSAKVGLWATWLLTFIGLGACILGARRSVV